MKKHYLIYLLSFALIAGLLSLGFLGNGNGKGKNDIPKPNTNDVYDYISINQILMWVANNGSGSHDVRTNGNGFYWPGGENATKSAIFQDGLIWAGRLGSEIRMNGNTHALGLQAGKILPNGQADDFTKTKYRVFKIRRNWQSLPPGTLRDRLEKDWNEWPVEDGAPWVDLNADGAYTPRLDEPQLIGDEVLWFVMNDMDPSRSLGTYGTLPIGLEIQTTVFGFNRVGDLGDMVFKKYKLINKGTNVVDDMILGYWSDTDLGQADDDFTGCDTILKLGYTYNATNTDGVYGSPPPSVGYVFFQGPIVDGLATDSAKFNFQWIHGKRNLPMTAFTFYINGNPIYVDPAQQDPQGAIEFYNYLSGRVWNGSPFIDPNTGAITNFVLAGDPVRGTGWYEGAGWPGGPAPDDRRHLMASGPFQLTPGDTQEVVVGIVIAQQGTNLGSVTSLKKKTVKAQTAYDIDFQLPNVPQIPPLNSFPSDRKITLWWDPSSEDYRVVDPLLQGQGLSDTAYIFKGYRIWQYSDAAGGNPTLLATYDVNDGITKYKDWTDIDGTFYLLTAIEGNDQGVRRSITLTEDKIKSGPLYNGSPYYYGISVFAYCPNSIPTILESSTVITEVFPQTPTVDITYPYTVGDEIPVPKTEGTGDGTVVFRVVDPGKLTGDTYSVRTKMVDGVLQYDVYNDTKSLLLAGARTDFGTAPESAIIIDGLAVSIKNTGLDSLTAVPSAFKPWAIKSVNEVKGPGGTAIAPRNVLGQLNSTGTWMLRGKNKPGAVAISTDERFNLDWNKQVGYNDYEIRFTAAGSEYYGSGYASANWERRDEPKGKGTVPFELWNITDASRMFIKVLDRTVKDTSWTQDPVTKEWEAILAYTNGTYTAPLPNTSGVLASDAHKWGYLTIVGDAPAEGTVVRIETWKPLSGDEKFAVKVAGVKTEDVEAAKTRLDLISVFPNPYFGANQLELNKVSRFVRFTNLPQKATIRIFTLSGTFIRTLEKDETSQYFDWDLLNSDGLPVASGMFIAYIEMPNIGTKVLKIAVIRETQYLDRI